MQEITIYSHLAHLISNGYQLNIRELVSEEDLDYMKKTIKELGYMTALKTLLGLTSDTCNYVANATKNRTTK
ncbi:MAG: hypothetical protein GQ564_17490 [Bacteroidales bacterium]|nr:hypothetical protein [Bacteroidales bacterium]